MLKKQSRLIVIFAESAMVRRRFILSKNIITNSESRMRGNQEDQQGTCIASTPENDLKDRRGRLGGLIGGLLGALPYVALTLGSAAVSTTVSADSVLEEVIVTARKRSESIQDVPVSVTAIGQELKESSVRRLEDIQNFAFNFTV